MYLSLCTAFAGRSLHNNKIIITTSVILRILEILVIGILCLTLSQTIFCNPNPLAVHLNEADLYIVIFISLGCSEIVGKDTAVETYSHH